MVRDVFHVSGLLRFDASGSVVEIVLNQGARLARSFICPLQALLAPLHVVVSSSESVSIDIKRHKQTNFHPSWCSLAHDSLGET